MSFKYHIFDLIGSPCIILLLHKSDESLSFLDEHMEGTESLLQVLIDDLGGVDGDGHSKHFYYQIDLDYITILPQRHFYIPISIPLH